MTGKQAGLADVSILTFTARQPIQGNMEMVRNPNEIIVTRALFTALKTLILSGRNTKRGGSFLLALPRVFS